MKDLESYRQYLDSLLKEDSSNIFLNGGIEYASIVIALLFANAKSSVNMFCEGLNPAIVKDEVKEAIEGCSRRGVEVNILVETDKYLLSDQPNYSFLNEKINIRKAREKDLSNIDSFLGPGRCNFTVCDGKMVRIEMKPEEYKAVGSFNKPEWAKALNSLFHESFSNAERLAHYDASTYSYN